ncbi:MAG: MFS transporter, partial [Gammaproteobacteria bacterium]|nr:MFS transporter [Gammaproteobacteria bacterium]
MQNRPDFSTTHRWLIITAVMLAAMLESLDMTVTSVALPNLMGVFDVSSNSISWVITAYVTATAIVMPIVGLLVSRVGRKRLLLISTLGFALFSFSCGMVDHFDQMIFFRTLQGLFSAALIPLAQSIVINTFPKEQCNKALAIWSSGIVIACVLGPTVGGCILQTLGWRWIFFLNIPICFLVLVLTCFYISESEREHAKIDWLGFISLIIFAGLLQLLIDRGTKLDWFASRLITYGIIIMIISAVFFIFRGIKLKDKSVIDFAIF